jgi:hypothetical protein
VTTPTEQPRKATARDLFFFTHPEKWPTWPFLPVVRRLGVLYAGIMIALASWQSTDAPAALPAPTHEPVQPVSHPANSRRKPR